MITTFLATHERDTQRLGSALALTLPTQAVVCLTGTLGAGKTALVRAVLSAVGIDPDTVTSPTFTLCHEHRGRRTVFHLDLYRVRSWPELDELGLPEMFAEPAVSFIEWGERFLDALPADRLDITIELLNEDARQFTLCPRGAFDASFVVRLEAALQPPSGRSG